MVKESTEETDTVVEYSVFSVDSVANDYLHVRIPLSKRHSELTLSA